MHCFPTSIRSLLALLLVAGSGCDDATLDTDCPPQGVVGQAGQRDGGDIAHVIHISVDGLRPDALDVHPLPAFERLRSEGVTTDNARPDADSRFTLPNHTTQLTGLGVAGPEGHNWTVNLDPDLGITLHSNKGRYVPSVFDVVHDAGLRTGAYVSKSKFSLFDTSYDAEHGAPDTTGPDDGPDKVDTYVYLDDTDLLADRLLADLDAAPAAYTFAHFRDPDAAGHANQWDLTPGSAYLAAIAHVNQLVGRILDAVEADPALAGRTAVVLTADHGGQGLSHDAETPENYSIPFYVWGAGIAAADLYALNADRSDPGTANTPYGAPGQPVRNGDAANLSAGLLGLAPVPGSTIGADPLAIEAVVATEPSPECRSGGANGR